MRAAGPERQLVEEIRDAYDGSAAAWATGPASVYRHLAAALIGVAPGPLAGARVLDLGTGTGVASEVLSAAGARPIGLDLAPAMLAYQQAHRPSGVAGDAHALPFRDGAFDAVISTFGVMFAADHAAAARELARVCRPGGRLALIVWAPEGAVQEFLGIIGKYNPNPPPEPSPLAWGEPDHATALLGDAFDLTFEDGVNNHFLGGVEAAWTWYAAGFGPMKALIGALPPDELAAFKQEIDAYHAGYRVPAGLHVKREYLAILGRRR